MGEGEAPLIHEGQFRNISKIDELHFFQTFKTKVVSWSPQGAKKMKKKRFRFHMSLNSRMILRKLALPFRC